LATSTISCLFYTEYFAVAGYFFPALAGLSAQMEKEEIQSFSTKLHHQQLPGPGTTSPLRPTSWAASPRAALPSLLLRVATGGKRLLPQSGDSKSLLNRIPLKRSAGSLCLGTE